MTDYDHTRRCLHAAFHLTLKSLKDTHMKKYIKILILSSLIFAGCQKLDLNPLSEGSSENWYSNEQEFELALNELYRPDLWYVEGARVYNTDRFTDDWNQREYLYDYVAGTITSDWADSKNTWINTYKGIARANTVLSKIDDARGKIPEGKLEQFKGEAAFFRASFYSYLIFLYGDVPLVTKNITIDEAFETGRTDKDVILQQIYNDYDTAAKYLPETPSGSAQRVTKGAAYAFKARTATWMLDYQTAKDAAGKCIDLGTYSLDPDYGRLFLASTNSSPEYIFVIPKSIELTGSATLSTTSFIPRYVGGTSTAQPSWELLCAYTCTDGLPIDQSDLYDPQHPFQNRDPRLPETIVQFGTPHLGYIYDPGAKQVLELSTGEMVDNKETQFSSQFASYNGLDLKKGVDESWVDDKKADPNIIIMRYADVLLMYAEAKMELNEIDQSVLDALNQVRARAYKVSPEATSAYPAITETDQGKLRTIIRTERHVELAWENRRYFDLIRWKLAETVLSRPVVALPQKEGLAANISSGDYFFPKNVLPDVDENGLVDLQPLINTGKVRVVTNRSFQTKEYLWPIPTEETDINENLLPNNPGY